eukprot:751264-Hanusia_phi.AAC.6
MKRSCVCTAVATYSFKNTLLSEGELEGPLKRLCDLKGRWLSGGRAAARAGWTLSSVSHSTVRPRANCRVQEHGNFQVHDSQAGFQH